MRIFDPTATWVAGTSKEEANQIIESCGRVCYQSGDKATEDSSENFVKRLIKNGHHSVLEHASATFNIVCDRGISHELVRHRIASFSQESTRYCDYSTSDMKVIFPDGMAPEQNLQMKAALDMSAAVYKSLRSQGVAPEIARAVLPTCLATEIVMTANFREWRHFLKLRLSPKAHPQMREIAKQVARKLNKISDAVFPMAWVDAVSGGKK